MRKSFALVVSVFALLVSTGCGSSPDEGYLADYHAAFPGTDMVEGADGRSIETAKETCEALDKGLSVDQLGVIAMDKGGMKPGDAAAMIALAIKHYCPQHFTQ